MGEFSRTLRGYDPEEVKKYLDGLIPQVEQLVKENKDLLLKLEKEKIANNQLKEKLAQYERTEETMNKALIMAQKTSEQLKLSAHDEREAILEDAKKNANRIVNEALLQAEKAEHEAQLLKRNMNIFKRRVKDIVTAQLEVISEFDHIEL